MLKSLKDKLYTINEEVSTKLLPANIKKDVTILGVTGTYQGSGGSMKEYSSVALMEADIANISAGEVVKVTTNPPDYYIKDTGVMVLLVKETETLTPTEYDSAVDTTEEILSSEWIPYIELEYIESTGTQYIDAGIKPTNHTIECKFEGTGNNTDKGVFGTSWRDYSIAYYDNDIFWTISSNNQGSDSYSNLGLSSINDVLEIIYNNTSSEFILNNSTVDTGLSPTDQNRTLTVFKRNEQNICASGKLYYFKIKDKSTGNLLRDFVPAMRKIDNEICLYDKVTETFFTNQGTGVFVAGPAV